MNHFERVRHYWFPWIGLVIIMLFLGEVVRHDRAMEMLTFYQIQAAAEQDTSYDDRLSTAKL